MRKLAPNQLALLKLIAEAGGTFMPYEGSDPGAVRELAKLVKAKRLSAEQTDGGYRYHLTAQGRSDAGA